MPHNHPQSRTFRLGTFKVLWCMVVLGLVALAASACTAAPPALGQLAELKQLLASCEPDTPLAAFIQIDGTASNHSAAITKERLDAIESVVRQTAVCTGHLRVVVFSVSSAATTVLFDGPLRLEGATDNARLKRVPAVVDDVMKQIKKAYEPAIAALPPGGSDVTAMYRLAAEWIDQLGDPFQLHLYLFTDGLQNVGVDLGRQVLTSQEAKLLANSFELPQLPNASVVVSGLGRVAGPPPPSSLAEGLVHFYNALCKRAGASRCRSLTDYSAGR